MPGRYIETDPRVDKAVRTAASLINDGKTAFRLTGSLTESTLNRAREFGSIEPPADTVFLVKIGGNSRVSQHPKGQRYRTPVEIEGEYSPKTPALLLCDRLRPLAYPPQFEDDPDKQREWTCTVGAYVCRFAPEISGLVLPTHYRVHLGHTAVTRVTIFPRAEISSIENQLHTISRSNQLEEAEVKQASS